MQGICAALEVKSDVCVAVLGMCPALAVTNTAVDGLVMDGSSLLVLTFSILFFKNRNETKRALEDRTDGFNTVRLG